MNVIDCRGHWGLIPLLQNKIQAKNKLEKLQHYILYYIVLYYSFASTFN